VKKIEAENWLELNDEDLQNLDGGKSDESIWINWLVEKIKKLW